MECYYQYKCIKCNNFFTVICETKEAGGKICPSCGHLCYYIAESRLIMDQIKHGYISAEKQSKINCEREGKYKLEEMVKDDPVIKARKEKKQLPWYRDGSVPGLPKDDKPLNMNEIKDINKYIE